MTSTDSAMTIDQIRSRIARARAHLLEEGVSTETIDSMWNVTVEPQGIPAGYCVTNRAWDSGRDGDTASLPFPAFEEDVDRVVIRPLSRRARQSQAEWQ